MILTINDEQLIKYYKKQLLFEEYEEEELEQLIVDRLKTNDNKGCKCLITVCTKVFILSDILNTFHFELESFFLL